VEGRARCIAHFAVCISDIGLAVSQFSAKRRIASSKQYERSSYFCTVVECCTYIILYTGNINACFYSACTRTGTGLYSTVAAGHYSTVLYSTVHTYVLYTAVLY